ncbi:proteasome subunit alpha type 6 [Colletotrichum kahawae]|uniref:Proteasome subunit alpha type 6 n=1 Tax=Colletotrichum kahawae TaxID=34407 RepID=A0AAD9YBC9_COLKA|nr:proteasome subunit alpha type 6 [Colletotrichum kahawae]
MSAKVPAWKRLGLKLKSGPEIGSPAVEGSKPNGHQQHHDARNANGAADAASAAAAKRKRPEHSSVPPAFSSPLKRTRTDDHHHAAATPPTLRKQKSVTFTEDTKNPTAAESTKKKNKSKKPATQQPQADIKPSLEYLRAWKHARATWKFNKNYQSILMKRVFHTEAIPSADIDTFYEYIQDLKGFTRTRLRETADEVRKEDAAQGKAAFPEGTPDADSKQSEYEKVLAGLKQLGAEEGSGSNGKRKRFDESGFVSQSSDVAITQRVIKRMRAETILEELVESEDADAMTIDTEETPSKAAAAVQEETVDKRVKLNDGTKQSASRRRKQRTANVDSSSDESSDDDSDDDSSSDSDSSDDDSDNESEVQRQAAQRDAEETSSSSSSSEEEDDDSSDDDRSEEEEVTTKKKKSAGKR